LLLKHSLFYGFVLSVLLSGVTLGSLYLNPEIGWRTYPPDVRQKFGPMSEKARKQRIASGILFLICLVGILYASVNELKQVFAGSLSFATIFGSTFLILSIFNVVDLIVLDWLIFARLRPRFIVLPGTEGLPGYGDYGFYFKGFLTGIWVGLVGSLLAAGITMLL